LWLAPWLLGWGALAVPAAQAQLNVPLTSTVAVTTGSAATADAQLAATLDAPLVTPRAPQGPVVPSQVLHWRQEATALEHGDNGMPRDPARAATLYCQAARHGDADSQFALAWMLTNARGIERDEPAAAYLFAAAAEQGMPQALRMAQRLGTPLGEPPPCLRPPEPEPAPTPKPPPGQLQARRAPVPVPAGPRPLAEHPLYADAPKPIAEFVRLVAPDYQVTPQFVLAIMSAESNFNPNVVSPKNAHGLMQLIPGTAARFQVRNIMDPAQNIRGGMAYLRWLLATFQGDVALVAAAYNAGERAVERYRGVPPYAETRAYVRKVMALLDEGGRLPFDAKAAQPSPVLPLMQVSLR
jgi:hypothetical protein